jgi:hypothetical protein
MIVVNKIGSQVTTRLLSVYIRDQVEDAWHKMVRKFAQNRRRPVVSALQLSTCLCDGVIIVLKVVVFFFFLHEKNYRKLLR